MVAAGIVTRFLLLYLCSSVLAAAGGESCRGTPCYYESFDPQRVPWVASAEKNLEEVFKNYRYYSILRIDVCARMEVTEYLKGDAVSVTQYRQDETGALIEAAGRVPQRGAALYLRHCASCHGKDRLGTTGPALLPGNLGRLRRADATDVIRAGRPATQMPGFGKLLTEADVDRLVHYIYEAPEVTPKWGEDDIRASHILNHAPDTLRDRPVFDADPLNIFMVVETGDHHVTVLDGDRLEPLHRFPTRYALHGGLKYSPDGRFVYLASRDGWISKFDLYNLKTVAEIRAGINTRNVAVSGDGQTLLVGNYLPETLVLLDAKDMSLINVIPVRDESGNGSRVSAVYQAAPRGSFVAALKDIPEVWEIMNEKPAYPVRRIKMGRVLDDFFFNDDYRLLIGADRAEAGGQVIDLDTGKQIARLPLDGMPHLGSGITWDYQDSRVMATPNLKTGQVTVIDMRDWRVVKQIKTLGPGFFMRSHENTQYAWVDVFFGPDKDAMHVFDKRTLEIVKTIRPSAGKTSAHVEFTRDGRYALVSVWEMDGALVVYDAETLAEVKRIPLRKPSGKYNVYNKITRSSGTSH